MKEVNFSRLPLKILRTCDTADSSLPLLETCWSEFVLFVFMLPYPSVLTVVQELSRRLLPSLTSIVLSPPPPLLLYSCFTPPLLGCYGAAGLTHFSVSLSQSRINAIFTLLTKFSSIASCGSQQAAREKRA